LRQRQRVIVSVGLKALNQPTLAFVIIVGQLTQRLMASIRLALQDFHQLLQRVLIFPLIGIQRTQLLGKYDLLNGHISLFVSRSQILSHVKQ